MGLLIHIEEAHRFRIDNLKDIVRLIDQRSEELQRFFGTEALFPQGLFFQGAAHGVWQAGRPLRM